MAYQYPSVPNPGESEPIVFLDVTLGGKSSAAHIPRQCNGSDYWQSRHNDQQGAVLVTKNRLLAFGDGEDRIQLEQQMNIAS